MWDARPAKHIFVILIYLGEHAGKILRAFYYAGIRILGVKIGKDRLVRDGSDLYCPGTNIFSTFDLMHIHKKASQSGP